MLLSLLERSAQYGQLCPLLLRLLTDASHSLFLLTALPALDASQIAAGVYDNCNTGPSFFWRSFVLTCHTNSPCCHQNILLDRTVTSSGTRGRFLVGYQICTSGESASPWFRHNSQGICFHGSWCGNKRSPSRHASLHIASILLFQSQKRHHAASKENKLLQRQRCLCHQLKIPPRKLRCTVSSRGNLWCQTACLSRYRLIWSFCFAADHPETQRSSITSTSFFSSNFFTQPRSAFPALVAATLASSFS